MYVYAWERRTHYELQRMRREQTKICDCVISDGHKTVRQKNKNELFWFWGKKRRKRTYFGRGTAVSISRPYVNKRNRLILGEGKRKKRKKTVSKQKGGFIVPIVTALAPTVIDLVKKLIRQKWLEEIEFLWLNDKHQKQ